MQKRNIRSVIILSVCICCIVNSCTSKKKQVAFDYGTKSDSALFYFQKGWEHIMDKGEWTLSEEAFRKAVDHDPDFLIGKSLVARISDSLEERQEIKEILESQKESLTADERLLLDVYMLNIDLTNAQTQAPERIKDIVKEFSILSEENYRTFVHKYPEESYIKAEYIEVLYAGYGPQIALDSLQILTSEKEREEHLFFKSYASSLEAELGNYEQALVYANEIVAESEMAAANPHVIFADIYFKMDSLQLAKKYIDKALALDPKHIIAQRLKRDIENRIENLSL